MANPTSGLRSASVARPQQKKKKKGHGGVIALVILLLVGAAAVLLYFNVSNLRDMLFDQLRNLPLIGGLIPAEESAPPGRFSGMSKDQLVAEIDRLESQVQSLETARASQQSDINGLRQENDRLREFEDRQEQFKKDQEAFNAMVYNESPLDFWAFYQKFDPDQAAVFAQEAAGLAQNAKEVRQLLDTFKSMDEKRAAQAMENLMDTSSPYVKEIMLNLDPQTRAAILDNMGTEKRSALLNLINPF